MSREEQLIGASPQVSGVHVEGLRRLLERKSALLALLEDITLEVSRADSLEALFGEVLGRLGRFMGWPLGHAYLWSADSSAYVSSRIWYPTNGRDFDPFRRATEATCVPAGEGIVGCLAFSNSALRVQDIAQEPQFCRGGWACDAGLRCYFTFPVLSDEQPNPAVLEFFADEAQLPEPEMTEFFGYIGRQLGQASRRYHVESALRVGERQLAEAQGNRMAPLARQMVTAQEDERWRLASELHGEAGQALTAIKMSLDFLRASLRPEQTALAEGLAEIGQLTNSTMQNRRRLSHNRRPPGLDLVGLSTALEGLCQEFGRYARLEIECDGRDLLALSDMTTLSQYRFAQAALTNIAKHALASRVKVQLDLEEATLSMSDDRRGFDLASLDGDDLSGGKGLRGMRERLEMIGGSPSIRSAPDTGTLLKATVLQIREAASR